MMAALVGAGTLTLTLGLVEVAKALVTGRNVAVNLITYVVLMTVSMLLGSWILG